MNLQKKIRASFFFWLFVDLSSIKAGTHISHVTKYNVKMVRRECTIDSNALNLTTQTLTRAESSQKLPVSIQNSSPRIFQMIFRRKISAQNATIKSLDLSYKRI